MSQFTGQFFSIQPKHSGKSLAVYEISENNDASIVQFDYVDRDNHHFLLVPLDDGYFCIVARHSGKGLAVSEVSQDNDARIVQYDYTGGLNHQFRLKDAGGGFWGIIARHSNKGLAVYERSTDNDALIVQWDYINQDNHQFKLVERGNISLPTITPSSITPFDIDFPATVKIQSLDDVPPAQTSPVLVGETLLPFLFIKDGLPKVQVKDSPYYIFRREQYWKRDYYYHHNGASSLTKEISVERGLTQNDAHTIESVTGIQVSPKAEFAFTDITLGISGQISYSLKVTTTTSTTSMEKTVEKFSRTYPAGEEVAEAIWSFRDHYTIFRPDGSKVTEWEISLIDIAVYEDKFK
jgi:Insecticidal Crystal Toxin, P42/Ricin-type beta-trefoil lectin domain-like